ncbi:unnamed protein product, partial [Timema podura]|nr:unnamed protein product [Timema podura]
MKHAFYHDGSREGGGKSYGHTCDQVMVMYCIGSHEVCHTCDQVTMMYCIGSHEGGHTCDQVTVKYCIGSHEGGHTCDQVTVMYCIGSHEGGHTCDQVTLSDNHQAIQQARHPLVNVPQPVRVPTVVVSPSVRHIDCRATCCPLSHLFSSSRGYFSCPG